MLPIAVDIETVMERDREEGVMMEHRRGIDEKDNEHRQKKIS